MKFFNLIKKELKRYLTLMIIPHNKLKPIKITFSIPFLILIFMTWTGLTIWAGYISSRQIDYWRIKADNQLMKLKVIFFAEQIRKSRELLDQVKDNDKQLRALLQLKTKKNIIQSDCGGPTQADIENISRILNGKMYEISQQDINKQIAYIKELSTEQLESCKEILNYIEYERSIYQATPYGEPCKGNITSQFGYRTHPVYGISEFHTGIDIANTKNTPIYSTAFGIVKLCEWQPGYGRLIVIDHGFGYLTYYGHLEKILVQPGEKVKRGQLIGLMGDTGTSTGIHLHYEIRYNNHEINPYNFMKKDYYIAKISKNLRE